MLDKIKSIPEKVTFTIGLALILLSPFCIFFMSFLFPLGNGTKMIIGSVVYFFAVLLILSAADKRHSRMGNKM
ncbi:hypothetical protein [Rossellomorea aquimaris]|uniref:Uncharacterized protein n=1 Tax=Rossellomorea aquimaris TaxID=189382 RepID=A0A366EAC2_9BACI|nr:hypothetical protein [Rossellomorea aquimaris]RBO98368.1 hypothetical protein DET59_1388 [Rossellomorea aquimaris]